MNVGMISKRYAKALLEYAIDEKSEDKVYSEMKLLAKQFAAVPRLRMAMDNPTLAVQDKLSLVKAALDNKTTPVFDNFVQLVLKQRRESYLQSMALSYGDLYCELKHINTGRLVTATPVDKKIADKMKALVQQVKQGDIDFESAVDPDIEGGFVLYFDTYRYDASVRTQLNRIKQQLMADNAQS
ncbi:F0F1 ATP synthase subunit delta [Dysgonomonas sp. 25]|uniref:F0F1 ATP synthase subunit delta n=1 Tax=Dysgonomonas sp. 25 TaxID=2302933 RepID=UPI0013D2871E|nr:F0F1 ATP synthase subunit delta [Dysgonomonas sp. 25]NDV68228.1 F0F1 ATP synthase subunit delta [Dysgonomonas sp. 25]